MVREIKLHMPCNMSKCLNETTGHQRLQVVCSKAKKSPGRDFWFSQSLPGTRWQRRGRNRFMGISCHYSDDIMSAMASQITSLTIVYSAVYSSADQRKHQSSASLAFVRGIHRWPVNSPHKWPVTRKMLPFDDVIMEWKHRNWESFSWILFYVINWR